MAPETRKTFIQTAALVAASLLAAPLFAVAPKKPLLSFSTLGCPDWSLQQIVNFAAQHGYKGIEVRGLQRQLDLTQSPEFVTAAARKATLALMKQKGLQFVGLGSSANLHEPAGAARDKNLAEARRFIDLAQQLRCPYVRVFPNNFPKEEDKKATITLIVEGLLQLGAYAKERNVTVLMETHGDVVRIDDLAAIMQAAQHAHVGLVWDVANMWVVTKEAPTAAYNSLKGHIRHVHIKDAKLVDGKLQYSLLGEGDIPIWEAITALHKSGYAGYYSFEWEKLWHPEIAEPEVALAHYPTAIKKHLNQL